MQDLFQNPAVLWFIAGLALLLAELALPGLIILFFGVGAWLTALVYLFFDIGFNTQLVVFMLSSVLALALLRRYLLKTDNATVTFLNTNELNQDFIGHTCTVSEPIAPGPAGGRVQFRGTNWKARAEVPVTAGETVRIIAQDSIVLIVEPLT
ncbi:membrane protein [Adhaeribacter aerolatus]|uniref:Membrane protein n=1 Tax=Adhaeribacter aerolatus TaxID=670289 RepID=A0A512AV22_9BACT|nr:NfeD family protein [Adhaeribacter aerolatus]GEO03540.1 membrane protein [Adhaeribacter aerolatus]